MPSQVYGPIRVTSSWPNLSATNHSKSYDYGMAEVRELEQLLDDLQSQLDDARSIGLIFGLVWFLSGALSAFMIAALAFWWL